MSNVIFRNYSKSSIRSLLVEIGEERYNQALEEVGLSESKPITMEGFFVQFHVSTGNIDLYYRYPIGISKRIMSVLGYWKIPDSGWEFYLSEPESR